MRKAVILTVAAVLVIVTGAITASAAVSSVIIVWDTTVFSSESVVLYAELKDANTNNPVSGKTLSFEVTGACAGSATTDGNGRASFVCADVPLPAGTYEIGVEFAGDGEYEPASGSGSLFVLNQPPVPTATATAIAVGGIAEVIINSDAPPTKSERSTAHMGLAVVLGAAMLLLGAGGLYIVKVRRR